MLRRYACVAALLSLCLAQAAWALGLGEIDLQSSLNQPLRAEVPLLGVDYAQRSEVQVKIASPEAFARVGLERSPLLNDIRIRMIEGASGQAVVQLSTSQFVREPYLSLLLEVEAAGSRMVREYSVLLDPPVLDPARGGLYAGAAAPSAMSGPAERPVPRAAAGSEGRRYGPVQAQETLWRIAYNLRPDPATITMDQMQLAIYQANPEAFESGLNSIRAGSMLRIPPADEIRRIDPELARREVARYRRGGRLPSLREQEPAVARLPTRPRRQPSSAPIVAQEPQGRLRLSTPKAAEAPAASPAETASAAGTPEAAAAGAVAPPGAEAAMPASGASGTLQLRDNSIKALELLAVHAREAAARGQAPAAPLPPEPTPPTVPAAPETVEPPVVAEQPVPSEATAPTAPSGAETAAPPGEEVLDVWADGKQPQATEAPAPASPPAKPPADSLPTAADLAAGAISPLQIVLGAVLLLLLLLGLRQYRLRQRTRGVAKLPPLLPIGEMPLQKVAAAAPRDMEATQPLPAAGAPAPALAATQPVMPPPLPRQVPPPLPAASEPPFGVPVQGVAPAATGSGDAYADVLGEADIHIAYGLYDEAERLLQEPLRQSPQRRDLHLKLLEVYFSAGKSDEFLAAASKLRGLISNAGDPDWEKVCIMGRQICPGAELFVGGAGGASASLGSAADLDFSSMLAEAGVESGTSTKAETSPADDWQDLSSEFGRTIEIKPETATKRETTPSVPETLEFDLGDFKLDSAPLVPQAQPQVSTPPAAGSGTDFPELDIDLSDFDVAPAAPVARPAAQPPAAPAAPPEAGAFDMTDDALLGGGDSAQSDTRLDLARAYMDMGEPAMAQSLLAEVVQQGTAAQKQEAQELLKRLSA